MKYELEWDNDTLFVDLIDDDGSQRIFSKMDQSWEEDIYNIPIEFNHDGSILVTDVVTLLNIILYDSIITGYQNCSGDMNVDYHLDVYDIVHILIEILGD